MVNWDATMDRKLFLAVLKTHAVAIENKAVAEELSKDGEKLTANAISKRLQKIRAIVANGSTDDGDAASPPSATKATARKRGKDGDDSPSKRGKTGKCKAGKERSADVDDEDDATFGVKQECDGEQE